MTIELLSTLAGGLLSLLFSYFPGLSQRYNDFSPDNQRFVMLGALFVVALGILGLSCGGLSGQYGLPVVTCDSTGIQEVVKIFVYALIANQAVHRLTPTGK